MASFLAYFQVAHCAAAYPTIAWPSFTTTDTSGTPVIVSYLTEGAANVIWEFKLVDSDEANPSHQAYLYRKLLRLRKGVSTTKNSDGSHAPPPYLSTKEVFEFFDTQIKNLFQIDELVDQEMVKVDSPFIDACNKALDDLEAANQRKPVRKGWHLKHDDHGLLMTDMRCRPEVDHPPIEFKPKWLSQSPTAPIDARRCRTCAMAAMRNKTNMESTNCPIAMIGGWGADEDLIPRWGVPKHDSEEGRALYRFFTHGDGYHMLTRLRDRQDDNDVNGVRALCEPDIYPGGANRRRETTDEQMERLSMAMTLRDCTLFAKLRRCKPNEYAVEARFADLDPKSFAKLADRRISGDDKSKDDLKRLSRWYWDEDRLIVEGWYQGTEKLAAGVERHSSCYYWNPLQDPVPINS